MSIADQSVRPAHEILRAFEQRAPQIDTDRDYRIKETKSKEYYWASAFKRGQATAVSDLREMLIYALSITESRAKALIKEAFEAKEIVRIGMGSATCYRTVELQAEIDQNKAATSKSLIALGDRARALGLPVAYKMSNSYGRWADQEGLARDLDAGFLVCDVRLDMPLLNLVTYLEAKQDVR